MNEYNFTDDVTIFGREFELDFQDGNYYLMDSKSSCLGVGPTPYVAFKNLLEEMREVSVEVATLDDAICHETLIEQKRFFDKFFGKK